MIGNWSQQMFWYPWYPLTVWCRLLAVPLLPLQHDPLTTTPQVPSLTSLSIARTVRCQNKPHPPRYYCKHYFKPNSPNLTLA